MHRLRGLSILAILVGLFVLSLNTVAAALDNNLAWNWLYHAAEGQDPETEDVPGGGGVEFRTVDPSGNVYPTTSVDIYALTEEGDASSANVRYWTTSEHWVSMTKVYTVTDTFRGQGPKTFDVWKTTIPPQTAGMTVYYRVQINDGSHDAYLKADEGDFQNPLGQNVDDNNDDSWDYSYTVSPAPGGGTGNCDVAWNETLHDTFDPEYRSPIGATIPGITVTLRLRAAEDDLSLARVRVWNDRLNSETFYTMTLDTTSDTSSTYDWWRVAFNTGSQPTAHYYIFEMNDAGVSCATDQDWYVDDDTKFYGGGMGEMSDGKADGDSFQITVYDPNFAVPDWMQKGIVYQVFPDRFRDGNSANNPPAGRFSYNTSGTIVRSNGGNWNSEVCDPRSVESPSCPDKFGDNFYGGDLAGITEKINAGYFDHLGVSVLYLNPIFRAPSNHKYDTADYKVIDPDFGTLADFQALVAAAHAHGMEIMLDGVFNHTSSDSTYFDRYHRYDAAGNLTSPNGVGSDDNSGACESNTSPYYSWYYFPATGTPGKDGSTNALCNNGSSDAPQTYEAWYGYSSLPKLKANSLPVRMLIWADELNSVGPYWTQQGAGGWRFDVGGDVDPGLTHDPSNDYWEGFRAAVRDQNVTGRSDVVMLGEEWGDATAWLLGDEWDSVMNYRFRSALLSWLFTGCSGADCSGGTVFEDNDSNALSSSGAISQLSPSQFNARLLSIWEDYPPMAFKAMMNLEGSHDTNRLRFLLKKINNDDDAAAIQRMKEWWLFAFTYAGAPTLYYGDEVGLSDDGVLSGGTWEDDPYNRAPFPWNDTPGFYQANTNNLLAHAREMASIRQSYAALQDGDVQHGIVLDDANKLYGFARTNGTQTALIVLNRSNNAHAAPIDGLNAAPYNLADTTVLVDALSGGTYTVVGGTVTPTVNSNWGVVLLEQSEIDTPEAVDDLTAFDTVGEVVLSWSTVVSDTAGGREVATAYEVHSDTINGFTPDNSTLIALVTPPNFGSPGGLIGYTDDNGDSGDFYAICALNGSGERSTCAHIQPTGPASLTIDNPSRTEGHSGTRPITFTVSLAPASPTTVTVSFGTADDTATAGSDYVSASGVLTFAPGTTTQPIAITINGDTLDESDETFFVNLSNAQNATVGDPQGQGTILNDDVPPSLTINDRSVTEGHPAGVNGSTGTKSMVFTVSLSGASGQTVTVNYATANGTAQAGSDYVAASGQLTFAPGTTTQPISVTIDGDTLVEPDETFFVNLSGAAHATIDDVQGQGTILDDDLRLENDAFGLRYDGWARVADPQASPGGATAGFLAGNGLYERVRYTTPDRTRWVSLITYLGPNQGRVRIVVGGVSKVFDLYNPTPVYQHEIKIDGLPRQRHVVEIVVLNEKNSASSGRQVRVDGFRTPAALAQETNINVRYNDWRVVADGGASGGNYRVTETNGDAVFFTVTGDQFTWITQRGPNGGWAQIIVDRKPAIEVNLYNPTVQKQHKHVVSGLGSGWHTVKISALGTRPAGSGGRRVVFDAVNIP